MSIVACWNESLGSVSRAGPHAIKKGVRHQIKNFFDGTIWAPESYEYVMRNPRIHYPRAVYHVMSRGAEKRAIFVANADRRVFMGTLVRVARESDVRVLAYCLMGNHYHLLVSVSERPLSEFMHHLLTCYAHYFNQSRRRVGHLFQGRYKAILCEDLGYLLHLITYIHLNPVRAGMTKSAGEWPWSSHEDFIRMSSCVVDFARLATLTGMNPLEIRDRYIERLSPMEQTPRAQRPSPAELLRRAADANGLDPLQILSGRRGAAYSRAKRRFLRWTKEENYSDVEIADYLGCSPAALSYLRRQTF